MQRCPCQEETDEVETRPMLKVGVSFLGKQKHSVGITLKRIVFHIREYFLCGIVFVLSPRDTLVPV